MRVTLHDYVSDPSLTQKDGVNLAHENIATLLRSAGDEELQVDFHDFNRLLGDDGYARRVLSRTDCLVSNVGPHAHYYFYLRERLGLDFHIIRDVRTALWSSYLHQEHLLRPYLREHDLLMVASRFTCGIYERMFPHLRDFRSIVCYPLTVAFPDQPPPRRPAAALGDTFTLGYVGRLSEDKNFPDIVELLIHLNRRGQRRYRLLACGDIHSDSCHPNIVRQRLARELGADSCFEYVPPRHNGEIWELYGRFDAMVFPSTSNLETLGRVLIEASYAGIPVVCGDHAAATELIPPGSLCRVEYTANRRFFAHSDQPLGRISIAEMAQAITGDALVSPDCHLEYASHRAKFLRALRRDGAAGRRRPAARLTASQRAFIERIDIALPPPLSRSDADAAIAGLIPWFLGLQQQGSHTRRELLERLLEISQHLERTRRFMHKTGTTKGDFTDVGGIDIELCHVTGFNPHFHIEERPAVALAEVLSG
jgi:glycosyltransferase involved in cell wall biosynthesis